MHGEKKICIRLTLRRIVGALMLASIAANLVIVGAVFGADSARMTPTVTALLTTLDRFTHCFHAYRHRHLQAHSFLMVSRLIHVPEGKPRRCKTKHAAPNLTMQTSLQFACSGTGNVPGNVTANISSPPHNPLAPGVDGCLGPVHEMQLAQDVADVTLDSLLA